MNYYRVTARIIRGTIATEPFDVDQIVQSEITLIEPQNDYEEEELVDQARQLLGEAMQARFGDCSYWFNCLAVYEVESEL